MEQIYKCDFVSGKIFLFAQDLFVHGERGIELFEALIIDFFVCWRLENTVMGLKLCTLCFSLITYTL